MECVKKENKERKGEKKAKKEKAQKRNGKGMERKENEIPTGAARWVGRAEIEKRAPGKEEKEERESERVTPALPPAPRRTPYGQGKET